MEKRLKELRKFLGLNQAEFGERLGIKQSTVTGYETGSRSLSDAVILSICREFHVSEEWLRTGSGEMFVKLDMEDELARMFGELISDDSELAPVKRSLIHSLLRLDPAAWHTIAELAESIVEANKKEEQDH